MTTFTLSSYVSVPYKFVLLWSIYNLPVDDIPIGDNLFGTYL